MQIQPIFWPELAKLQFPHWESVTRRWRICGANRLKYRIYGPFVLFFFAEVQSNLYICNGPVYGGHPAILRSPNKFWEAVPYIYCKVALYMTVTCM